MTYNETKSAVKSLCDSLGITLYSAFEQTAVKPQYKTAFLDRVKTEIAKELIDTAASKRIVYLKTSYSLELTGAEECFALFYQLYKSLCQNKDIHEAIMGSCKLSSVHKMPVTTITFSVYSKETADFVRRDNEDILFCKSMKVFLDGRETDRKANSYGVILASGNFRCGNTGSSLSPCRFDFSVSAEDEENIRSAFEQCVGKSYSGFKENDSSFPSVKGVRLYVGKKNSMWTDMVFEGYIEV